MTTIVKVAKHCGLSKSTVSRFVSGRGYVSSESQVKIEAAIQELGYIPNQIARDFRSGSTKTIGFIAHGYFDLLGIFLNHFMQAANEYNYFVTLYLTDGDKNKEIEAFELLKQKKLDGIFILTKANDWELIRKYTAYGPISTWHKIDFEEIYSCSVDHYEGYEKALNYLYLERHKQKIGHVLGYEQNKNTLTRLQAITDFYTKHDLILDEEWLLMGRGTALQHDGRQVARKWFQAKNRPTAMIFHEDYIAGEFISELGYLNVEVPRDVSVIGCDNSDVSKLMNMTTIDYSFDKQARNSFFYLYNQLHQGALEYAEISINLLKRQTVN